MALLGTLIFTLGCQSSQPEVVEPPSFSAIKLSGPFTSCRNYTQKEIFSYCIYLKSEHLHTLEDVHYYCPLAEKWEEACRFNWGSKRARDHRDLSFEQLLDGCAGFSDCTFEIIDALPSKDINTQLDRCRTHVKADLNDCLSHAMQMWLNTQPSVKDIQVFLEKNPYLSKTELSFVAEHVHCKGWEVCTQKSNNHIKCRQLLKHIKKRRNVCRESWGNMRPKR